MQFVDFKSFKEDGSPFIVRVLNGKTILDVDFGTLSIRSLQTFIARNHCCNLRCLRVGERSVSLPEVLMSKIRDTRRAGLDTSSLCEIVKYLFSQDVCNINEAILCVDERGILTSYYQNTVLNSLVASGIGQEALWLFEECKADPFISDGYKNTLHFIVARGYKTDEFFSESQFQLFNAIVHNSGSHINDVAFDGSTALHIACARRDLVYIEPLIHGGGDIDYCNNLGHTPLDVMKMSFDDRMVFIAKFVSAYALLPAVDNVSDNDTSCSDLASSSDLLEGYVYSCMSIIGYGIEELCKHASIGNLCSSDDRLPELCDEVRRIASGCGDVHSA